MAPGESIDPNSGYCSATRTYHSLLPSVTLPPQSSPLSITDVVFSLLRSSSSSFHSLPAFIDASTGDSLSYSLFLRRVRSLSSSLRRGTASSPPIKKGDVALILSPSSLHLPVLHFSLLSLGAVVSPANPLLSDSELSHIVRISTPAVVFSASSSPRLPLPTVLLDSPEFDSLLTDSDSLRFDSVVGPSQSDLAAILYSSGTTGMLKGVEITHRNLTAVITCLSRNLPVREAAAAQAVTLVSLPLFHMYGFFMMLRSVAMADASVLLGKFSLEGMLSAVERFKVSFAPVSPPVVVWLVKSELTKRYDLRSLRMMVCGGAPLSEDIARRLKAKFPWIYCAQGYGLTESSGIAAKVMGPHESPRYGSVGCLHPIVQAKVVDPLTGEAMPPGHLGELWLRGPNIMKGYIGDEESNRATFSEGWMKTGDICYFDEDGYMFVVDRLKELIKYKGYQVPPAELESLLLSHPNIADAAVIPYPNEEVGQIPMAYVVRTPGSCVKGNDIIDFVAKQVAPYKKIRRVEFINEIPRSPQGKILRRVLVLKNQLPRVSATASRL